MSAKTLQYGGDHYLTMKIQPVEYILANGLGFCEGCVVKYVSRWRSKGGIQDLKKARHFIDMLIEEEEDGSYTRTGEARDDASSGREGEDAREAEVPRDAVSEAGCRDGGGFDRKRYMGCLPEGAVGIDRSIKEAYASAGREYLRHISRRDDREYPAPGDDLYTGAH